jgi:hypothetical protein
VKPTARTRAGLRADRVDTEESLGRCRAVAPLVRAEHDVVCECDLEPSLQVLDGEETPDLEGAEALRRRVVGSAPLGDLSEVSREELDDLPGEAGMKLRLLEPRR